MITHRVNALHVGSRCQKSEIRTKRSRTSEHEVKELSAAAMRVRCPPIRLGPRVLYPGKNLVQFRLESKLLYRPAGQAAYCWPMAAPSWPNVPAVPAHRVPAAGAGAAGVPPRLFIRVSVMH